MHMGSCPASADQVTFGLAEAWRLGRESESEKELSVRALDELRFWLCDEGSRDDGSLLLGRSTVFGTARDVLRNNQFKWSARLFRVMKLA